MRNFLFTLLFLSAFAAHGQIPYTVTVLSQPYQALTGATSINNGATWDDDYFQVPLGFSFNLAGTAISKFSLMAGNHVGTDTTGIISGFIIAGADIYDRGSQTSSSGSPISYQVSGTPGNRVFKAEVQNAGFFDELNVYGTSNDSMSAQVWLYEGSDVVELRFGPSKVSHPMDYFGTTGPLTGFVRNINLLTEVTEKVYYLKGDPLAPAVDSFTIVTNPVGLNAFPAEGTVYRFTPVNNATGVHTIARLEGVSIYPTNCTDILLVNNLADAAVDYRILTSTGQEVLGGQFSKGLHKMEIGALPTGMYLMQLINRQGQVTERFNKL